MKSVLFSIFLLLLFSNHPALAGEDVVLDSLVDELKRSIDRLRFESHPSPYFVSYFVKEVDEIEFVSCLGSETEIRHNRSRVVMPDIRIGNRDLDSSNPLTSVALRADSLPVYNNYKALRRSLWRSTDKKYKFAIRTLEWKKAFLSRINVPDKLADMAEQKSVVSLNDKVVLRIDKGKWQRNIQALSTLFKKYPNLQKSKISMVARSITTWYVNSEGSKIRDSSSKFMIRMYASAQAPDGMDILDYDVVSAQKEDQLPRMEDLNKQVENFSGRLISLSTAKKGVNYCGPVLFKNQASAALFSQIMAPNLGFAEDYIGEEKFRNPFKDTIGRRVLPDCMSVIDNPRAVVYKGFPLLGGYNFDSEGVPGKKINLIVNGRLNDFCRSRIPTRSVSGSNGHSFGGHGVTNILELKSDKTVTPDEMETKIRTFAKDAGLDHILVIEKMKDQYRLSEYPSSKNKKLYFDTPSYSAQPSAPIVAYYQYVDDGRKELLRGLEFNFVSLRAFRDIQAVGADAAPYLITPSDYRARHLISPSYLIGELDLRPVKPQHSVLPIVSSPLMQSITKIK